MSTWTVTFTDTFRNELLDLPKSVLKQVIHKIKILEKDPISAQQDAIKLEGYKNKVYRVHIGEDYRLIYTFGQGWVKILSVRKRDEKTYKSHLPDIEIPDLPPPPVESDLQPPEPLAYPVPFKDEPDKQSYPNSIGIKLTSDQLKRWKIPQEYWSDLLDVKTEDDLLKQPLPDEFLSCIIDNLFPRTLEEIANQPEYLLKEPEDLDRFVEGNLIGFLLKLDPEQEKLVKRNSRGAMLIKGGPGTGKSILALYRVKKLVEEGKTPILFTTYTNTLVNYSRQLLKQLLGQPPEAAGVEVTTVDALVRRYYIEHYGEPNIADKNQCLGCLQTALDTTQIPARDESERKALQQQLEKLGLSYLLEEILNVIEGRGISAWEEYQTTKGNITGNIKKVIWSVYQTWRERMTHNCYITWEQMRHQALEIVTQLSEKPYQALIVDEVQDLSPVALRFLLRLLPSLQGVYLTGDTSQSIYQQGFTWIKVDAELNLRGGRTRTLGRNYRNTQQISTACATILKGTDAGDVECLAPEFCAYQGDVPTLLLVDNQEQRIRAIQDFFTNAARQFRLPIHASAVLCPTKQLGEEIASQLTNFGMKAEFVTREMINLNQPSIKVLTIHSAKGLEFPFVAVVGLKEGLLPHIPPHLPSDEIPAAIDQQRRLFYVGCSRAMRALMVCGSLSRPSQFLDSLCTPEWQRQEYQ